MGLIWWVGLAVGWFGVGLIGINKLICNTITGGDYNRVIGKYSKVARAYKTNSGGRFG